MKEKTVEEIYLDYEKGLISQKELGNELVEFIFFNKNKVGLFGLSEDEFSEFILYFLSRITKIIDRYDKKQGSFENYFYGCINISAKFLETHRYSKQEQEFCLQFLACEMYDEKQDLYKNNEKLLELEDSSFVHSINEIRKLKENGDFSYTLKKARATACPEDSCLHGKTFFQEALIILALKSCYFIDYKMAEKISYLAEIPMSVLENLLDKTYDSLSLKLSRLSVFKNRRNYTYYHMNRYMLKSRILSQGHWLDYVNSKYKMQNLSWQRCLRVVKDEESCLTPTNCSIAKILKTDSRHIAYVLRKLKANIDKFSLKWYPTLHEDLFSKRQY